MEWEGERGGRKNLKFWNLKIIDPRLKYTSRKISGFLN